jgi:hypothetical protein
MAAWFFSNGGGPGRGVFLCGGRWRPGEHFWTKSNCIMNNEGIGVDDDAIGSLLSASWLRCAPHADVTIGSWMLAFNVTHFDDRRLCETHCSDTSVAVYDMPSCAGLCNAVTRLPELHNLHEVRRQGE